MVETCGQTLCNVLGCLIFVVQLTARASAKHAPAHRPRLRSIDPKIAVWDESTTNYQLQSQYFRGSWLYFTFYYRDFILRPIKAVIYYVTQSTSRFVAKKMEYFSQSHIEVPLDWLHGDPWMAIFNTPIWKLKERLMAWKIWHFAHGARAKLFTVLLRTGRFTSTAAETGDAPQQNILYDTYYFKF